MQDKDSIFLLPKIFQQMGKSKFKIKVIFYREDVLAISGNNDTSNHCFD